LPKGIKGNLFCFLEENGMEYDVSVKDENENTEKADNATNLNNNNASGLQGANNKKVLWITLGIIAFSILFAIILSSFGDSGNKTYVGTNLKWDVVIELKNDNTFTIRETNLNTRVTVIITGTYEMIGTNKNIIEFNTDRGTNFRCQMQTNIYGTPFISFVEVVNDYPPCYLQK